MSLLENLHIELQPLNDDREKLYASRRRKNRKTQRNELTRRLSLFSLESEVVFENNMQKKTSSDLEKRLNAVFKSTKETNNTEWWKKDKKIGKRAPQAKALLEGLEDDPKHESDSFDSDSGSDVDIDADVESDESEAEPSDEES